MNLYLNGYRMDTDNTVLSLTYNFNNSIDGNDNSISHSNQITLPATKRNRAFFEYYKSVKIGAPKFYQCYVVNPRTNITVFFGFAFLVDKQVFAIEVYQNPIDFFDLIDPLKLSDLNFTSTLLWDTTTATAARNSSSGLASPLVQYGQIDPTDTIPQLFYGTSPSFYVKNYPPHVFFKTVLEKIFSNQGYSMESFSDVVYDNLLFTYGLDKWIGPSFKLHEILPDFSQKDIIAQFQMMFGIKLMLTDSTNTFRIKKPNDVLSNSAYYNWSAKFMGQNKDIINTSYNQNNVIKWANTELHAGGFSVPNPYLKKSNTLFESPFNHDGSETYTLISGSKTVYGWKNPLWTTTAGADLATFETAPQPNLIVQRDPISGVEPDEIFFHNNTYIDYKVGYKYASYDGNQPALPWNKYGGSIAGALGNNYGYECERYYNLNDIDVMLMQQEERMIFDRGEVYAVKSIVDYVPNQITKVQMFRVI